MRTIATALALTTCLLAASADAQLDSCVTTDYSALPTTDCGNNVCQSEVSDYYDYLVAVPTIADAMDWCDDATGATAELPQAVRDAIFEKFEYAQANPSTGTLPVADSAYYQLTEPLRYTAGLDYTEDYDLFTYSLYYIGYTQSELIDIYSSKIAHALWLDVTDAFDWKLSDYTEGQIRMIVDPLYLWGGYPWGARVEPGTVYADFSAPLGLTLDGFDLSAYYAVDGALFNGFDPSPADAYDVASASIASWGGTHSPKAAAIGLAERIGRTTHAAAGPPDECYPGGYSDPLPAITLKDFFSAQNTRASIDPVCPRGDDSLPIARRGCHDRATMAVALHRAVNIPAYHTYGVVPTSHEGYVLPTIGYIVSHADDPRAAFVALSDSSTSPYANPLAGASLSLECSERDALQHSYWGSGDGQVRLEATSLCYRSFHWGRSAFGALFCTAGGYDTLYSTYCASPIFKTCNQGWYDYWQADLADRLGCSGD